MERLNWHMADELSRVGEVRVVGPSGSAQLSPAGVEVAEVPLKPLARFLVQVQWQALREAMRWKPDWVLAGSGLTAPAALLAARCTNARAAAYVHGLDLAVSHPVYKSLWLTALRRMDRVVANSMPTGELARDIGIARGKIGVVHPGVEMPSLSATAAARFRAAHDVGVRPLLLSVGRLSERKGLLEFVAGSLPRIAAKLPDVLLLIVGDAPTNALRAKAQTKEGIQRVAAECGVGGNLRFMGQVTDAELADIYQASDVHVFPVREIPSDPEGFGMVAIEAAAHGLPTVAFATGGTIDAVAEGRSGRLVESGDYQAFADAALEAFADRQALAASSVEFARRFAWPQFGRRLARELAPQHDVQRGRLGP